MTDTDMIVRYPWIRTPSGTNAYNDIPDGWHKAFGQNILDEIDAAYQRLDVDEKSEFQILYVKEKWGALSISYIGGNEEIDDLMEKYTELSLLYCMNCGEPATLTTKNGWIIALCDECRKEK